MTIRWKQLATPAAQPVYLATAKQHCRIVDITSIATQANIVFGNGDSQLLLVSKVAGAIGNQYSAVITVSGANTTLLVSFASNLLTIRSATNGSSVATSTVEQIVAAISLLPAVTALFDASFGSGNGSGVIAAATSTVFTNGVDSGDEDSYVSLLIDAATEVVEARCGRAFISRSVRMFLDRWPDGGGIDLPLAPVSSITSVKYWDYTTEIETDITGSFQSDIEDNDLPARLRPNYGFTLPITKIKINAISVDFVAGFGTTPAEIPAKIKQCILFLVAHWYAQREPVISGTAILSNKVPFTFETALNSFRIITV